MSVLNEYTAVTATVERGCRNLKGVTMKERVVSLPEIALIASTRGMLGAGIGLLLAGKLNNDQRRAAGWALVIVGAVTTIPLVMNLFGHEDKPRTTALRAA